MSDERDVESGKACEAAGWARLGFTRVMDVTISTGIYKGMLQFNLIFRAMPEELASIS